MLLSSSQLWGRSCRPSNQGMLPATRDLSPLQPSHAYGNAALPMPSNHLRPSPDSHVAEVAAVSHVPRHARVEGLGRRMFIASEFVGRYMYPGLARASCAAADAPQSLGR